MRSVIVLFFATILLLLGAVGPVTLAQKEMPGKPRDVPADREEDEEELEEEKPEEEEVEEDSSPKFTLAHEWKLGETYTTVTLNSFVIDVKTEREEFQVVATSSLAFEWTIDEFEMENDDDDIGTPTSYTLKVAQAVRSQSQTTAGRDSDPAPVRAWKTAGMSFKFDRASSKDEWTCTISDRAEMEEDDEGDAKICAMMQRIGTLPSIATPHDALAEEGTWEPESEYLGRFVMKCFFSTLQSGPGPDGKVSAVTSDYEGEGTLAMVELIDPADDESGEREEEPEGEEAAEKDEGATDEPFMLADVIYTHKGTVTMSEDGAPRQGARMKLEGTESLSLNTSASKCIYRNLSLSGTFEPLEAEPDELTAKVTIESTTLFFDGDAESAIADNDLAELFEVTEEEESDKSDDGKRGAEKAGE